MRRREKRLPDRHDQPEPPAWSPLPQKQVACLRANSRAVAGRRTASLVAQRAISSLARDSAA